MEKRDFDGKICIFGFVKSREHFVFKIYLLKLSWNLGHKLLRSEICNSMLFAEMKFDICISRHTSVQISQPPHFLQTF